MVKIKHRWFILQTIKQCSALFVPQFFLGNLFGLAGELGLYKDRGKVDLNCLTQCNAQERIFGNVLFHYYFCGLSHV